MTYSFVSGISQYPGEVDCQLGNVPGPKRALFMEALVQYRELVESCVRDCLADAPTVRAAFERLFMQVVDEPEAHEVPPRIARDLWHEGSALT